jgi:hypothetical protein|nr:MAG TPA: hypothetical protein [Caudoviricetes sp.]
MRTRYEAYKKMESELVLDKLSQIKRIHDEITKDLEKPAYYTKIDMLPERAKDGSFMISNTKEDEVVWRVTDLDGKYLYGKLSTFLLKSTEDTVKLYMLSELKRNNDFSYNAYKRELTKIKSEMEQLQKKADEVTAVIKKLTADSHRIQEMIFVEKNKEDLL